MKNETTTIFIMDSLFVLYQARCPTGSSFLRVIIFWGFFSVKRHCRLMILDLLVRLNKVLLTWMYYMTIKK